MMCVGHLGMMKVGVN